MPSTINTRFSPATGPIQLLEGASEITRASLETYVTALNALVEQQAALQRASQQWLADVISFDPSRRLSAASATAGSELVEKTAQTAAEKTAQTAQTAAETAAETAKATRRGTGKAAGRTGRTATRAGRSRSQAAAKTRRRPTPRASKAALAEALGNTQPSPGNTEPTVPQAPEAELSRS